MNHNRPSASSSIGPFLCAMAVGWSAVASPAVGQDIGFVERFALSSDRQAALRELIPGTEDFYYYRSLHWLNQGRYDKLEPLLRTWISRHRRTPRVQEILNRRALLQFDEAPKRTADHVRRQLKLKFDHEAEAPGRVPRFPTRLDSDLISRETLTARARRRYRNLDGFEDRALEWVAAERLNADRRRDLLRRLRRPDYPNLVEAVVADLARTTSTASSASPSWFSAPRTGRSFVRLRRPSGDRPGDCRGLNPGQGRRRGRSPRLSCFIREDEMKK